MRIFNEDKTEELKAYDGTKGYTKEDTLVTHVPYSAAVEEKGYWKTVMEYPNGGKDVEWVSTREGHEEVPEHDETEDILVYVPYSDEELDRRERELEVDELKAYLSATDYMVVKCMELGLTMSEKYPEDYRKRIEARARINEIEEAGL